MPYNKSTPILNKNEIFFSENFKKHLEIFSP